MAGFWHLSHHQMRDPNGEVYAGARASFYEADGLTPLITYQDYGLGTEHPHPVVANAYGVFPPVFFDEEDGFYRQRITSSGGVIIPGTDVGTLPIIGPGEGGGGAEVPVDPNALLQTGDPIWVPTTGTRSGFVRMNGRTVGSATSGATERANADTEALFLYLWNGYTNTYAPVSGGRGVSAAADWAANKTIGLLDMRSKSAVGLDDMGATALGGFTGVPFTTGDETTAGASGGEARHTLTGAETGPHTHTGTTDGGVQNTSLTIEQFTFGGGAVGGYSPSVSAGSASDANIVVTNPSHTHTFTTASGGGGAAHNNMPPFIVGTWYQKL